MISVNKQWSTWITFAAGLAGAVMAFFPQLGLPEPWPAILMLGSSILIYVAKNIKQKVKGN